MADVFGLKSDVFFGSAAKPLPNWRESEETDEDEDSPQPGVAEMLGFDPSELDESETAETSLHESASPATIPETPAERLARRAAEIWSEEYP